MDTAWYYTFSTTAQSLSGIIGIILVFMIFKFQNIENNLNSIEIEINKFLYIYKDLIDLKLLKSNKITQRHWNNYFTTLNELNFFKNISKDLPYFESEEYFKLLLDRGTNLLNHQKLLFLYLFLILLFSFIIIFISILLLMFKGNNHEFIYLKSYIGLIITLVIYFVIYIILILNVIR